MQPNAFLVTLNEKQTNILPSKEKSSLQRDYEILLLVELLKSIKQIQFKAKKKTEIIKKWKS